ncbi:MAG: RsmB/NOP family class I SAM-dependent RNA methyltransferase [Alphaproteobacteria bacterium]
MPKRSTPQKPDAKPALTAPKGGKPAGARPSARGVALELLTEVLEKKRPLDELLDGNRGLAALEPRDRAFAYLMTATVLRRLGQIDALIAHALARPLPAKAATAQNLLRLGIAQLLFLKVPAHAAVGETVELAEAMNWGGFKGLINAVLRRLGAEGEAILAAQDAPRLNTPDWLWQSWSQAYGEAAARDIAAACLEEPPLDLTVKANAQGWAAELEAELLPTGTLRRRTGGDVKALPGFAEGAWWVQDAAAALPARMLGDVAGKRVLDLCAAPGGKTAQLALAGAKVTALERSAHRLRRLAENLARLRLSAELVAADVELWRPEEPADAVLLDAPCTATGALRRHPDIRHLKTPADVTRMAAEQDRLLKAALAMLRPGGLLVYAVCSLELEEGPARIAALLGAGAPLRRRPLESSEINGLAELVTPEGDLRTLPCHLAERGGLDGFYACRLERL